MSSSSTPGIASQVPLELKIGTELHDRYVVSSHIGSGGYATVWKATDKKEGRDVAIKRFHRSHWAGSTEQDIKRVLEEAQNTSRLKGHRNIVEIYETFEANGEAFIVMEFVDGPTLDAIFRQHVVHGTWIEVDEAIDLFRQLLEGLVFAHSSGVIHRDIKPSNLLTSRLGVLKIADFGIAKQMAWTPPPMGLGRTGFAGTGSQQYMSYEQSRGETVDQRTDIFSAGIIGYLLLTGRHPFNHPSAAYSIFDLIREQSFKCEDIPPRANLPESARKAVMRMLTKDRSQRYHSIYEPLGELTRGSAQPCPTCASPNPVGNNFCGQCGSPLKHQTPAPGTGERTPTRERPTAVSLTDEGFELTRLDNWDEAIEKYRQAMEIDPTYARVFSNLGFALNRVGRYQEAVEILRRGLAQTKDQNIRHRLYDSLGFARSNLRDFTGAIDDFARAIELNPDNPRPWYHRAESRAQIGERKEAYGDLERALDLDPDFWPALRLKSRLDAGAI